MSKTNANQDQLKHVNWIRFTLPITLFLIVVLFEAQEHEEFTEAAGGEVLFFGVLGPTAVFIALTYISSLLKNQIAAHNDLETLNQNLEQLVKERTQALAARNDELAQANGELKKLDEMKSDFVSLVSHELRAPLTTINGGLELALQEVDEMTPKSRRLLRVMMREVGRLTRLVQTILDMSQLEAGKLTMTLGPIAIAPLLKRAAETAFPDGKRPFIWHIQPDLPPLWADEIYLEQIIANLITNADKYTPPQAPIEMTARVTDGSMQITVADQGPGIPADIQSRVFDRFYRHQNGERLSGQGWGLGLYFARALTGAQNGRLTIQSPIHATPNTPGAAFTITLPLADEVPDDE